MKPRNIITQLISMSLLAAMAVIGSLDTAEAQHVKAFTGNGFAGVIAGQTLRVSIVDLNPEHGREPVQARALLYDELGNILAPTGQG